MNFSKVSFNFTFASIWLALTRSDGSKITFSWKLEWLSFEKNGFSLTAKLIFEEAKPHIHHVKYKGESIKSEQVITLHSNSIICCLQNVTTLSIFNISPWSKKINRSKSCSPEIVFCSFCWFDSIMKRHTKTWRWSIILRLAGGPSHFEWRASRMSLL